ncbi:hypothetical protein BGW38_002804 [Lunasporangiospora selenospora]|uniref:Uncharacterized protein n=1 Tax=Lunasporangiospora selenospora TaxID=979761 RepID=A0A9P6G0Q9_9FUNG|nr:hypothetical protein BGW38_002804 [Lunasporangiospora selenospora]
MIILFSKHLKLLTMKYLLTVALVLLWNCTFVMAFVDPISLSVAGAAVLAYLGASAAVTGTLGALFVTGGVVTVSMINQKLREEKLPELNINGDMLMLCYRDGYSLRRTSEIKSIFCGYFVSGHTGDCDVSFEKYRRDGLNLYTACFHAYVNSNTTLQEYETVSDKLNCRVYNKLEATKFYKDNYYQNNSMCRGRVIDGN